MPFARYLDQDTIHKIVDGIQQSAPVIELENVRNELLTGIIPGFVATLPNSGNPRNKILSDLDTMNTVPYLLGNEVPLQQWLTNAVQRLRFSRNPRTPYFQSVLEDVAAKSQQVIADATGIPNDPAYLDQNEKIVHKDDMLPYGWIAGAISVGRSIARLTVPRHESGFSTGSKYFGTGWLIGSQHLITNHHVINARNSGEPPASEADLHLQATATSVDFDYDDLNVQGNSAEIEKLCTWSSFNNNPSLDYAILKLTQPITDRQPLILAPQKLNTIETALGQNSPDKPPVNIIQHPGGQPKMLGIRNNQIHQITGTDLSYFTDTEGGSSGSPVCSDEWQVIALHKRWTAFYEENILYQGKNTAWENRGTRIDRIINDLKQNHNGLWEKIGTSVIE